MESTIVVEKISKKYDIGKLQKDTQFREALINFTKRVFFRNNEKKEEIWALKDVSFSANYGEIIGIVGPNGAGKSTLLKILSKITYPTSGRIKVLGRVASLLEVGTGFHEELTGRENIFLNGSILGMKKDEVKQKLDEIISFSGVEKFLDTPIKRYSTGMRLRLGFSVAAHLDTDVLFIDEVLAVGDVAFQKKCLNLMGDFTRSGRTVLFVSHNMPVVENLCPRVLWIDNGEIRKDGDGKDVIGDYMSQYAVIQHSTGNDLTNVYQREGSGEIRFTRIEYLDPDGQPKNLIRSGESLKVRLYFQVHQSVSNPSIYFRIYGDKGIRVATFGNLISGQPIPRLHPGTGYVDLDIDFLNFMPDRYYLNLEIRDDKKKYIDHLVHFSFIDVEVSNYYKSGMGIDKNLGITFLPYKWDFGGIDNNDELINNR